MRQLFSIRNIYFLTALGILVYLVLRAMNVPPVHDEGSTYIHYIQTGEWLPYRAHMDANNHIINSLLSGVTFKIFGIGLLPLRLASLLFFPLYVVYVYKLGKLIQSTTIRVGFICAMLGIHNLMEYFAYSRGYAMSMALLMPAIYYVLIYFKNFELKKLWPFYIFSFIALIANFTLFNTMIIMNGMIWISFLMKNKQWLLKILYLMLGVAPLVVVAVITIDMKNMGLLYYGGSKSFYHVTVATMSLLLYGMWNTPLAICLVILSCLGVVFLLSGGISEGVKHILFTQRWFLAVLFLGNILATVLLQLIMKVNYPEDRTAMYFYFMLVLFICFSLDQIRRSPVRIFSLLGFVPLLYFPLQMNLNHSAFWHYEHIPNSFYQEIKKRAGNEPWAASIGGYNLMDMIWAYYNQQNGGVLNDMQTRDYPSFYYDYLLLYDDDNYQNSRSDYNELLISPISHIRLLERKEKIKMELVTEYISPDHVLDTNEYYNIYASDSLNRYPNLCFDVEADVSCPKGYLFGYITLGTFNKEEAGPHEWMAFHHLKPNWAETSHFRHRLYIPAIQPNASRTVCYLWNPKNYPINFTNCRIRIYTWSN